MHPLLQSKGKKPRTGEVRQCEYCQKEMYVPQNALTTKRYCSTDCHNKAREKQQEKTCPQCGKAFSKPQSNRSRYCSSACYLASRTLRKMCKVCGKQLGKGTRVYCSRECAIQSGKTGVYQECAICGKEIYVPQGLIGKKKYCSSVCRIQGRKMQGIGYRAVRTDGYIEVYYPSHPDATKGGRILEHRLVAEQKYGRRLLLTEQVHHINGDRQDNRPENLEIINPSDHARESVQRGVKKRRSMEAELEEYRRRYGPLQMIR